LAHALFAALAGRDPAEISGLFTEDCVCVDPHYPEIEMRGRAAFDRGMEWGLGSIEQFGFSIVQAFESDDRMNVAIEVDTHHVLKGGKRLDFPQVFIVEARAGHIASLRAYEPYRPNGIGGFLLRLSHIKARLAWQRR
jgi:ketosteroid isomerase-like protein